MNADGLTGFMAPRFMDGHGVEQKELIHMGGQIVTVTHFDKNESAGTIEQLHRLVPMSRTVKGRLRQKFHRETGFVVIF
jgi:hypothetical protein